ncbi:hypothetical protein [Streptomyces coerulescens]|uniref:Uncharacterized protein n=1 Tax=Streptomyces coerulescens TaxID=29304 RepID=A0ABW0CYW7_STRCD
MTTSLTQFAADDVARATDAVKALTAELATGDAELAVRRKASEDAAAELARLIAEEAAIRRSLGVAPLPADAEALVKQLTTTLVRRQHAVALAAATADALGTEERHRAILAKSLDGARRAVTAAEATKTQVDIDEGRVEQWTATVGTRPVTDALTGAGAALASPPYNEAMDRLAALLGPSVVEGLRRRATEAGNRDAAVYERLARARDALTASTERPSGALLKARHSYAAEVAKLRAVAEGASVRFAVAMRDLAAVRDMDSPTHEEQESMKGLHKGVEAALPAEKAVWECAEHLRRAEEELDHAMLASLHSVPSPDTGTGPTLDDLRKKVEKARLELNEAQQALAAHQATLDAWEAAVPEALKEQVLLFLAAEATLQELKDVRVSERIESVTNARDGLVSELTRAVKAEAAARQLADEVASRTGDADAWRAVAAARRAALVRGEA